MQINGIKYKINTDVSFGTMRRMNANKDNLEVMAEFIKEVLQPAPSDEELDEMGFDTIKKIMAEFGRLQKEQMIETKKKTFLIAKEIPVQGSDELLMIATLMSEYNQPYSEIKAMPYSDLIFFYNLSASLSEHHKKEMDKMKKKSRSRR